MSLPNFSLLSLLFCLSLLSIPLSSSSSSSSPYLSPITLFPDYQKMLNSFKVFIYDPPAKTTLNFTSSVETLFFSLLRNSSFTTQDPEEAHLFFIPLPFSSLSPRSAARAVAELRSPFPYWNRTLGADHFLVSCSGLGHASNRNFVELKKNSVLISCFPTPPGNFIPHKDIAFPPLAGSHAAHAPDTKARTYLGYVRPGWVKDANLVTGFASVPEIFIESEPSNRSIHEERLAKSKFCLFEYGAGDLSGIGEAMSFGCVPVLITDRPILDLPLMDVLTWQEIAVFVSPGGGVQGIKSVLGRTIEGRYEEMSKSCATASTHFEWNEIPQPHDSFYMLMYQLWLRRHTIRYIQREWVSSSV